MEQESVVELLLRLHEERFRLVYQDAIKDVASLYAATKALYNPTELANIMHAHVRDQARRHFYNISGIEVKERRGRAFCIDIDGAPHGILGRVQVKLKKLTPGLIPSNIPTGAVVRFNNQQPETPGPRVLVQRGLFGDDRTVVEGLGPTNLIAGYVPNAIWTQVERISVVQPTGLRKTELLMDIFSMEPWAAVIPMPTTEIAPSAGRSRIKARSADGEAEGRGEKKERIKQQPNKGIKSTSNVRQFKKRE